MRRTLIAVLSAVAVISAGVSGCSRGEQPASPTPVTPDAPTQAVPPAAAGPLPPPEALTGVLDRLADPGVPGTDKLALVEDSTPADVAALDAFGVALRDGGFAPVAFTATDLRWSDTEPGAVLAIIEASSPSAEDPENPDSPGGFAFPMEFRPETGGWQLTRETAEQLLAFGNARTEVTAPAPPPADPAPPP